MSQLSNSAIERYFEGLPPRTLAEYGYYPIREKLAVAIHMDIDPRDAYFQVVAMFNDEFMVVALTSQYNKDPQRDLWTLNDVFHRLYDVCYFFDAITHRILLPDGVILPDVEKI